MRKVLAFAALGLALSVSVAGAQGGGGRGQGRGGFGQGRGMFGGGLMLLNVTEVQTELKMTEPQIAKVADKQQALNEKRREIFQGLQPGGGGNREEMQAAMAKLQEEQTKAVNEILDTKQQKRFRQLELQQGGIMAAVNRKEVADALKITDDQKAKVREIQQAQMEELRNGGGAAFGPDATPEERQAFMKKVQEMQKASNDKVLSTILTDAQRAQWKEMTGEPFKFPPMQFGARRTGGNPPAA